jgi:hypothetical protein
MGLNPIEKVSNLAKKLDNFEHKILKEYIDDPEMKPFISSTAYSFVEMAPYHFLYDFSNEKWAKEHIDKAAKECIKEGERFLEIFIIKGDEPWAKPYLDEAIEEVSSTNPGLILENSEKEWVKDYISKSAKNMAEYEPLTFLYSHLDQPWAKDYIETAVKNCIKNNDTGILFGYYKKKKSPLLEPFLPLIAKTVAEETPLYFLKNYADEPELSSGIPIAFEILVNEKTALETLSSLSYYNITFNNPLLEPYIEDIAKKCVEENPREFVEYFGKENWAKKYVPIAAEVLANEDPEYFMYYFGYADWAEPYLEIIGKKFANEEPERLLEHSYSKSYFKKFIPIAAENLLNEKPEKLLAFSDILPEDIIAKLGKKILELSYNDRYNYFQYHRRFTEQRDDLGGKSFSELYTEQEERRDQEENNNTEGNNNTEDKIATLSKALRSMGLIKEAFILKHLIAN